MDAVYQALGVNQGTTDIVLSKVTHDVYVAHFYADCTSETWNDAGGIFNGRVVSGYDFWGHRGGDEVVRHRSSRYYGRRC